MSGFQLATPGLFGGGILLLLAASRISIGHFRHVNSGRFLRSAEWRIARQYVFKACGRRCCKCGASRRLNIDHVVPRGRQHDLALDITNLQVLCWRCNKAKGGKTTDYRTRQQRAALAAAAREFKAFMIGYKPQKSGAAITGEGYTAPHHLRTEAGCAVGARGTAPIGAHMCRPQARHFAAHRDFSLCGG